MPKIARIPHQRCPFRSFREWLFFVTLFPEKEGVEMESNDTGDLLLMLLDDDLFFREQEEGDDE